MQGRRARCIVIWPMRFETRITAHAAPHVTELVIKTRLFFTND